MLLIRAGEDEGDKLGRLLGDDEGEEVGLLGETVGGIVKGKLEEGSIKSISEVSWFANGGKESDKKSSAVCIQRVSIKCFN